MTRNKLVPSTFSFLRTGLFRREIRSIIFVMFKVRIKRNKIGKGIDLELYKVMFNIWIRTIRKLRLAC